MRQNTTTTTETAYRVSQQTSNFIDCLQQCSYLFDSILNALDCQYGEGCGTGTELIETDFAPALNQIRAKLYQYIGQSIESKQADLSNTEHEI